MSDQTRREFLIKLAKGTAYVTPVVVSMAAPVELIGQQMQPTMPGGMGGGMGSPPMGAPARRDDPFPPPPSRPPDP